LPNGLADLKRVNIKSVEDCLNCVSNHCNSAVFRLNLQRSIKN
jgi:hypothetical protein